MPNFAAQLSDFELEAQVAEFVRSYIRASRAGDSSEEQEALRFTCAALERLINGLLKGSEGWTGWVDGILPATDMFADALKVISPDELTVRGRAVWGKSSRGPFWIEPFWGAIRLFENTDAIVSYSLRFADATRELGTVAYGQHVRRPAWFFPAEWLFTFSKGELTVRSDVPKPTRPTPALHAA
jgi:hypothetical protein